MIHPNYTKLLRGIERRQALDIESYTGNKYDQSISSGMLCTDLILGNGGWISGWHTSLGFEQSAKTTNLIHSLHEALSVDTPIIAMWDYEKTFSLEYALNFHNCTAMDINTFGKRDAKGTWIVEPRIPSYDVHNAESFFDWLRAVLKAMPRKQKIGDAWFYVYPKDKESKAIVGERYSKSLMKTMNRYCIEAENGLPQAFIFLDSYPNMLPEGSDKDDTDRRRAAQASMFSDQMKRVKALVVPRNTIVLGVNQMRTKPDVMWGSPDYEPCGNALKLNSDIRLLHKECAIPQHYLATGAKDGKSLVEDSVIGGENTFDSYRFITVDIIKNKVGGANKGTRVHHRIWESDYQGDGKGLDPVFDTWQYLKFTGQLIGNIKKFKITIPKHTMNKTELSYMQFKTLIAGHVNDKKRLCKKLGISNPKLRPTCFAQLRNGSGYDYWNGKTSEE